jgi:hypothetical protein
MRSEIIENMYCCSVSFEKAKHDLWFVTNDEPTSESGKPRKGSAKRKFLTRNIGR